MSIGRIREQDHGYFSRRAAQERYAADAASGHIAERPHRELAERYSIIAASIREVQEQLGSD